MTGDWTMQCLADILQIQVARPEITETTALGAAWLAGSSAGVWPDRAGFDKSWKVRKSYAPKMTITERDVKVAGWSKAVQRVLQ